MARPNYKFEEILELAVAATEVNSFAAGGKNGYVKSDYPLTRHIFGEETKVETAPADYDGVYDNEPYVFSNRNLIKENLGIGSLTRWNKDKHNIPALNVTDEHRETAKTIARHFSGLTFKVMADKANDFDKAVYEVINKDEITVRDVGIIASLPGVYAHQKKTKADLARKKELAKNSTYIGAVGDRVETELEIVSHKYLERFDCYVVNAYANDRDMVAFFTGKSEDVFGKRCKIRGTVKRAEVSKYNGGPETFLTRVFVKEVLEA